MSTLLCVLQIVLALTFLPLGVLKVRRSRAQLAPPRCSACAGMLSQYGHSRPKSPHWLSIAAVGEHRRPNRAGG